MRPRPIDAAGEVRDLQHRSAAGSGRGSASRSSMPGVAPENSSKVPARKLSAPAICGTTGAMYEWRAHGRARAAPAGARHFLGAEQQRAEHQRHEVVHRAIGEQRAQQRIRSDAPGSVSRIIGLEHADAAGHVADDSGDHRGRVCPEEGDEAIVRHRAGSSDHSTGARQAHVDHPERDLREGRWRGRARAAPSRGFRACRARSEAHSA